MSAPSTSAATGDRARLVAAGGVRAVATGMMGVVLGLYLAKCGLSPGDIGLVVSAGLVGQAVATLLVTFGADRLGRRSALFAIAGLSLAGSVLAAFSPSPLLLVVAAGFGMLNGMGRDRGAAVVLEQAALPATTSDAGRTRTFAIYHLVQDASAGVGALLAWRRRAAWGGLRAAGGELRLLHPSTSRAGAPRTRR